MGPLNFDRCILHNAPLIGGVCGKCIENEDLAEVAKLIIDPTDMENTENEHLDSNQPR